MPTQSPPESGDGASGSANADLPENQSNPSADEQQGAASSDDSQDAGNQPSNEPRNEPPQNDDSSDDDKDLAKFAKSRGYDLADMSEREKKLLKDVQENQKAARTKNQGKTEEDIRKATQEAYSIPDEELENEDPALAEARLARAENAQLRAENRWNSFLSEKAEAKEYAEDMRDILVKTIEEDGRAAGQYLTRDLNRLLALAKAERANNDLETAREEGRKAEREDLRRKGEASAGTNRAASNSSPKSSKIDRAWLQSEYDPSNPQHRQMVDEALARGDLY